MKSSGEEFSNRWLGMCKVPELNINEMYVRDRNRPLQQKGENGSRWVLRRDVGDLVGHDNDLGLIAIPSIAIVEGVSTKKIKYMIYTF